MTETLPTAFIFNQQVFPGQRIQFVYNGKFRQNCEIVSIHPGNRFTTGNFIQCKTPQGWRNFLTAKIGNLMNLS